jgi:FlaA1/EpsC-like NDP-sugar epimerase
MLSGGLLILKGKTVLVTGAGGSIGSEICQKLLDSGVEKLKCYDISEYSLYKLSKKVADDQRVRYLIGDVRDIRRLERAIVGSDIVIHAAALKHVKFCEFNPDEAYKTNIQGTQNIVDACRQQNTPHCLLISTDKAVNPTSVMGTTKLLAEKLFLNAPERESLRPAVETTKFTVVRFGNVFGSAGSVIETFYQQIKNGMSLTLTHENISRYFISITEAVSLVLNCIPLSEKECRTPIFILRMKKAKIKTIAERMLYNMKGKADLDFNITGLSLGEKFDEQLYTEHEKKSAKIEGDYIIIGPKPQEKMIEDKESFMSEEEVDILVKEWLRKNER